MNKSLHNKKNSNGKTSKKKTQKGSAPLPSIPNYMYLIYTKGVCAEGPYLYHIRYLGFNLKQAFQYYHCLFTEYIELIESIHHLSREGIRSGVHRIILNQCRVIK